MSRDLLERLGDFIERYVTFANPDYAFVSSLWAAGTFMFPKPIDVGNDEVTQPAPAFDAFPYLVITSDTKRSGKTRFSEILASLCSRVRNYAGATPVTVFRAIRYECPTIFFDEAESMAGEAADMMRQVTNAGYRRGQTVPRASALTPSGVDEWPVYCPKGFILIGDVRDTLRDRAIIIRMQRAEAKERYVYVKAKAEGEELRGELEKLAKVKDAAIRELYQHHKGLEFLTDRDEEIWLPLFALCEVLAPSRVEELKRIAVDLATEKTSPARRYTKLEGAEDQAELDEYSRRLVRDAATVFKKGERAIFTRDLLPRLHELVVGPWRKYRGDGLTAMAMADMLSPFGLQPHLVKIKGVVARGYHRADIEKVAKGLS